MSPFNHHFWPTTSILWWLYQSRDPTQDPRSVFDVLGIIFGNQLFLWCVYDQLGRILLIAPLRYYASYESGSRCERLVTDTIFLLALYWWPHKPNPLTNESSKALYGWKPVLNTHVVNWSKFTITPQPSDRFGFVFDIKVPDLLNHAEIMTPD